MHDLRFRKQKKPVKRRTPGEPIPLWLGLLTVASGVMIGYFGF